jgi:hypothetical protein
VIFERLRSSRDLEASPHTGCRPAASVAVEGLTWSDERGVEANGQFPTFVEACIKLASRGDETGPIQTSNVEGGSVCQHTGLHVYAPFPSFGVSGITALIQCAADTPLLNRLWHCDCFKVSEGGNHNDQQN